MREVLFFHWSTCPQNVCAQPGLFVCVRERERERERRVFYALAMLEYKCANKATYGAFPLHGTARYGSLLGGFPLGTVPGTWYFLVPPQPRFQAIRTVTKT